MLGKLIGHRYRIEQLLGEGGMASVYLAVDEKLSRRVAVKVLHSHLSQSVSIRKRFQMEAEAISVMEHPNIIKIFDFSGSDSEQLWIVTEILKGSTLNNFSLKFDGQRLGSILACLIISEIAKALRQAHSMKIVHRDVKPENVMVLDRGQIKLMDFGISKDITRHSMTVTGTFMGSPSYMSPEQIHGNEIDHRTDIYSLGVLFYEIVTGALPFRGTSTPDLINKIAIGQFLPPREINPELSGELHNIICRTMAHDKELRFRDASGLLEALSSYLRKRGFVESHVELERYFLDSAVFDQRARSQRVLEADRASTLELGRQFPDDGSVEKTAIIASPIQSLPSSQDSVVQEAPDSQDSEGSTGPESKTPPIAPKLEARIQAKEGRPLVLDGSASPAVRRPKPVVPSSFDQTMERLPTYYRERRLPRGWVWALLAAGVAVTIIGLEWDRVVYHFDEHSSPKNKARTHSQPSSQRDLSQAIAGKTQGRGALEGQRGFSELPGTPGKGAPDERDGQAERVVPSTEENATLGSAGGSRIPPVPTRPRAITRKPPRQKPPVTNSVGALPKKLYVAVSPPAQIYMDGRFMGNSNSAAIRKNGIPITPGRHELELKRSGFRTAKKSIQLPVGQNKKVLNVALEEIVKVPFTIHSDRLPLRVRLTEKGGRKPKNLLLTEKENRVLLVPGTYTVELNYGTRNYRRVIKIKDEPLTLYAPFGDEGGKP